MPLPCDFAHMRHAPSPCSRPLSFTPPSLVCAQPAPTRIAPVPRTPCGGCKKLYIAALNAKRCAAQHEGVARVLAKVCACVPRGQWCGKAARQGAPLCAHSIRVARACHNLFGSACVSNIMVAHVYLKQRWCLCSRNESDACVCVCV